MDHFREEVVVKKGRAAEEIAFYLSFAILVVFGFLGLLNLSAFLQSFSMGQPYWFGLIIGLVEAGIAVLLFLFRPRLRTEYEYTFTNGALDFAQVYNNNKRKSLGSLNVKTVDAFGKVASSSFQRYVSMQGVKQNRWFLNRGADLYYFFFQKDGNKRIIVMEPSAEMVDDIKHYLPFGAWQD